jgi:tetratricopeptide (TPR) repeat protein
LVFATSCARRLPADYARSRAAAERAYSAGRYEEAAARWLTAAEEARSPRDAEEARYRAATSWERAGKKLEAAKLYDELAREPDAERSARAAFERAQLRIDAGDREIGTAAIDDAIRRYPESGIARRALERRLLDLYQEQGATKALTYLDQMAPTLAETSLAESVLYQRARYQEMAGDTRSARDSYLAVAHAFPYPYGAYWDDSLYHAAQLEVALGHPRPAIAHLESMLSKRESTPAHGSLERPRFGPARLLMAEIYRDELRDPVAARRTFLVLADEHPTSPLRDDALWEAALLAQQANDLEAACKYLTRLADEMPDSRYVACVSAICPRLPASDRDCRSYITDRIPSRSR